MKNHVVISGTGRTGTTFLVELLTHLGLATGFSAENARSKKFKTARAGLENDLRETNCPFIVKDPSFCDYAKEIIYRGDIAIEHVFIPVREMHAAAESRRRVQAESLSKMSFLQRLKLKRNHREIPGGLSSSCYNDPGKQEKILLERLYRLIFALSETTIPVTLMNYPRIVNDSQYLFSKLKPILGDINYASFSESFNDTARPELVHRFNENDHYILKGDEYLKPQLT